MRLGVRAVTVLAKYADAGEYSKFKFNGVEYNRNSMSSRGGGIGSNNGAGENPKKLKGLSRMVSKAALKAGLRKSKKEQQQQQQQKQKFDHDVASDNDDGNSNNEGEEMAASEDKKTTKQRGDKVGTSEDTTASEKKLVKVTMTLYRRKQCKDINVCFNTSDAADVSTLLL